MAFKRWIATGLGIIFLTSCAALIAPYKARKRLEDARRLCSANKYEECVRAYEDAVEFMPSFGQNEEIKNEYRNALIEKYLQNGLRYLESGQAENAISECESVLCMDKGYALGTQGDPKAVEICLPGGSEEQQKRAERCLADAYFLKGKQKAQDRQWFDALQYFEKAKKYGKDKGEVEREAKIAKKQYAIAERHYKHGMSAFNSGKYEMALKAFEKSYEIMSVPEIKKKVEMVRMKLSERECQRGESELARGQLGQALKRFEVARRWSDSDCVKKGMSNLYFAMAKRDEKSGKYSSAVANYIRAGKDGEAKRLLSTITNYKAGVIFNKNHKYANWVVDALFKNFSTVPSLVKENELKRSKVNFLLVAELSGLDVEVEQFPQNLSQKYQCDTRIESNPEYYRLQNKVESLRREIERMKDEAERYEQEAREASQKCHSGGLWNAITYCTDTSAISASNLKFNASMKEIELSMVELELKNTSPMREVPVYCNWHYQTVDVRKSINGAIKYQIVDPTKDSVIKEGFVQHSLVKTDRTVQNANPEIGIWEDPLELPSDAQLKELFIDELVAKFSEDFVPTLRRAVVDSILEKTNPKNCSNDVLRVIYIGNMDGCFNLPDRFKSCIPKEDFELIAKMFGC